MGFLDFLVALVVDNVVDNSSDDTNCDADESQTANAGTYYKSV
jgi:hypothetical protein